jgi:hypothetical protein
VVGTTDKMKKFHPFGLALVTDETEISFNFLFKSLLKARPNFKPNVLIADSAQSITNAFEESFGVTHGESYIRIHCYFHVTKNLDLRLKSVGNLKRKLIKDDITKLQLARNPQEFQSASDCLVNKWLKDADLCDFIHYFKKEYIDQRNTWYEGASLRHPSTNNSLEATNKWIKERYTLRERLPLNRFVETASSIVSSWSQERDTKHSSCVHFSDYPDIPTNLQSQSYGFAKSSIQIKKRKINDNNSIYFFPSSNSNYKNLKEEDINSYLKKMENFKFRSFDSYVKFIERLWIVHYCHNNMYESTCSCPIFMKNYICKHIVSIAIINKEYEVKPEAKIDSNLNAKRVRGRPKKSTKALVVE